MKRHANGPTRRRHGPGSIVRVAVLALVVAAVSAGCARAPIRIGFAGPLTGTGSDLGVQGRNGATLAVEELNAAGGILGHPVTLVPRDDRGDAARARELAVEFADLGVAAVVGHMTSTASAAIAPLATELGLVYLSPTASTAALSGIDDGFFRIQGATDRPAAALGRHAAEHASVRRVAVIADATNAAYADPYAAAFAAGLEEAGARVVYTHRLNVERLLSWGLDLIAMRERDVDAVLIVASAIETARFAQAVRAAGYDWQLYGSGWAATDALHSYGGQAVEGMLFARSVSVPLGASESGRRFVEVYRARFGREPSFAAAQGYDTVRYLATAIQRAGTDAGPLRRALVDTGPFETMLGSVEMDRYGDIATGTAVVRSTGGTFTTIHDMPRGRL